MMNNKDIPADKISERVARVQDVYDVDGDIVWIEDTMLPIAALNPYLNHNQFHEIWTADIEAKAGDVLHKWLSGPIKGLAVQEFASVLWWQHPKYQSNRRLWQLRAIVEVLGNA